MKQQWGACWWTGAAVSDAIARKQATDDNVTAYVTDYAIALSGLQLDCPLGDPASDATVPAGASTLHSIQRWALRPERPGESCCLKHGIETTNYFPASLFAQATDLYLLECFLEYLLKRYEQVAANANDIPRP